MQKNIINAADLFSASYINRSKKNKPADIYIHWYGLCEKLHDDLIANYKLVEIRHRNFAKLVPIWTAPGTQHVTVLH